MKHLATLAFILAASIASAEGYPDTPNNPDYGCKGCEPEPEPETPAEPETPREEGDDAPLQVTPGYYCVSRHSGKLVNFRDATGPIPKHGDLVRVCPWYAHP